MLVVELAEEVDETAAASESGDPEGGAAPSEAPDEPAEPGRGTENPPGAADTPPEESPRSPEPPVLRSIVFRLAARAAPAAWPRAILWLALAEAPSWRTVATEGRVTKAGEVKVILPGEWVGRDVLVQATALHGQEALSLPFRLADGSLANRLKIPGRGEEVPRLSLTWPVRARHQTRIQVLDSRGGPVPGATVTLLAFRDAALQESVSVSSTQDGRGELALFRAGATRIQVICSKPGWWSRVLYFEPREIPRDGECRISPVETPSPTEPDGASAFSSLRILDAASGKPVSRARVGIRFIEGSRPREAVAFGNGVYGLPTPIPTPHSAWIYVEAPCYQPFASSSPVPIRRSIPLRHTCRDVTLSLRLVQAGTTAPIPHASEAVASISQGGEPRAGGIRFDSSGYNEVQSFRFDPAGGPVRVRVDAPGYAAAAVELRDLRGQIDDGGRVADITIPMRPAASGVAVLLNAAERWPFYPRARDAVIEALRGADELRPPPDQLAFGLLAGSDRRLDAAAIRDPRALDRGLSWLGGMSAVEGQLTPGLLETRLAPFRDLWPLASTWQLVLVIPHNELAVKERLAADEQQRLLEWLRGEGIVLHVIEDGDRHPAYGALVEALGGRHESIEGRVEEKAAALAGHVARILKTQRRRGERG
ncbi:MAG: hypothetical protein MI919_09730 [Holophagales bacterium]|nr:hypothetical protein [Holophagales bacterium]